MRGFRGRRRHVDEAYIKLNSETHYLWRAVDDGSDPLESYVTKKRDKKAALCFFKKTLKRYGRQVEAVTDGLGPTKSTGNELGIKHKREMRRWHNLIA